MCKKTTVERINYIQASSASRPLAGNDKSSRIVWLRTGDIKVPEHLREKFVKFQPVFKKTNICGQDIELMQQYAEKERLKTQPRRK